MIPPALSVIVPTLNEAANIEPLLASLRRESGIEIVVVDGGSADGTLDLAAAHGATGVLSSPPGRAVQMNAGAAAAGGDVLLFLHADTRLPAGFPDAIGRALADPAMLGGAFGFRLDRRTPFLRMIEIFTNLRSRWLRRPCGDQALFVRAETFRAIGGFPLWPVMEDTAFVARLRRRGRMAILSQPATTSARRWRTLGAGRVCMLHLAARVACACGVAPDAIHRWLIRHGYDRNGRVTARRP
jgi:rSAM/selenodomain-associated transferase 2